MALALPLLLPVPVAVAASRSHLAFGDCQGLWLVAEAKSRGLCSALSAAMAVPLLFGKVEACNDIFIFFFLCFRISFCCSASHSIECSF